MDAAVAGELKRLLAVKAERDRQRAGALAALTTLAAPTADLPPTGLARARPAPCGDRSPPPCSLWAGVSAATVPS